MKDLIKSITGVISQVTKYLSLLLKTAPVRKMKKAIEAGERYIRCNEDAGKYKGQSKSRKKARLDKYREDFFDKNN